MAASRKKKHSPSRARAQKAPPRNGHRPLVPNQDKFDNPSFKLTLVFSDDAPMTSFMGHVTIPSRSFQSGIDDPVLHGTFQQGILDVIRNSLSRIYSMDNATLDGLSEVILRAYLGTSTADSRYFSWSVLGSQTRFYDPVALSKFLSLPRKDDKEPIVVCLVPDSVKQHIHVLATSVFYDDKKQPDGFFKTNLRAFPKDIATGFEAYESLQRLGNSPVKHFRDTIVQGVDGFWTSSLALYHVRAVESDTSAAGGNDLADGAPPPVSAPPNAENAGQLPPDSVRGPDPPSAPHNVTDSTDQSAHSDATISSSIARSASNVFSQLFSSPQQRTDGPHQIPSTVNESSGDDTGPNSGDAPADSVPQEQPPADVGAPDLTAAAPDQPVAELKPPPNVTTNEGPPTDVITDTSPPLDVTEDRKLPPVVETVSENSPEGSFTLPAGLPSGSARGTTDPRNPVDPFDPEVPSESSPASSYQSAHSHSSNTGHPSSHAGSSLLKSADDDDSPDLTTDLSDIRPTVHHRELADQTHSTDHDIRFLAGSSDTLQRMRDSWTQAIVPLHGGSVVLREHGILLGSMVTNYMGMTHDVEQRAILRKVALFLQFYILSELVSVRVIRATRDTPPVTYEVLMGRTVSSGTLAGQAFTGTAFLLAIECMYLAGPHQEFQQTLHYIADKFNEMYRARAEWPDRLNGVLNFYPFVHALLESATRIHLDNPDVHRSDYEKTNVADRLLRDDSYIGPLSPTPLSQRVSSTSFRRRPGETPETAQLRQHTAMLRVSNQFSKHRREAAVTEAALRDGIAARDAEIRRLHDASVNSSQVLQALNSDIENLHSERRQQIHDISILREEIETLQRRADSAPPAQAQRAPMGTPDSATAVHTNRPQRSSNRHRDRSRPARPDHVPPSERYMDPPLDPSIPSYAEVPPVDHAAEPAAAPPHASGAPAHPGIASPGAAGRAPVPPGGGNPPPDDPDDDGSSRHSSPGDIPPSGGPGDIPPSGGPGDNPPSGGGPPSGGPHPPDTSSLGSDDILPGHDWRKHHIDPRRLDELCVYWNKGVRSIHPWEFKRSETGNTINYPVRLDTGVASKTEFMNELGTEPRLGSEVHSLKSFNYGFPKLVENATKSDLCHWYSAVVDHCVSYGIFVAPFHTHMPGSTMGKWWEDAPAWCQEESHRRYCEHQLHQALVGKAANLSYSPIVKHLLRERRGYEIMYKIAKICGHPALTDSLSLIPIPTQKANMDLLEYLERWKHHAYIAFCHGITYSDRYFTEEFINRMHSAFDLSLKPYLFHLIRRVEVDVPVPFCWWPDQILTHILDVAPRLGLPLTTDTTPSELQPRKSRGSELRSTSRHKDVTPSSTREHPVRELDSEEIHRVDELYINQLADVHGLAVAINSLVAASSGTDKSCHFCGESSHLLRDCPIFQAILKDPTRRKFVLNILTSRASGGSTNRGGTNNFSASRSSTPPRSNIRSIDTHDDTDDEHVISRLTDDEETDDEPDFH